MAAQRHPHNPDPFSPFLFNKCSVLNKIVHFLFNTVNKMIMIILLTAEFACIFLFILLSLFRLNFVTLSTEVTKRVYFIGNERMLIAHDSNRLRFS